MTAKYIDMVTIHEKAVSFIAMGTHKNCQWDIFTEYPKRYPYDCRIYIGSVTTHIKAACFIGMGTHKNCEWDSSTEYAKR